MTHPLDAVFNMQCPTICEVKIYKAALGGCSLTIWRAENNLLQTIDKSRNTARCEWLMAAKNIYDGDAIRIKYIETYLRYF